MTTSASSTRRRAIALSSSFLRFSTTDFLFRLSDTKFSLNPSFNGGHWRRPSPLGGSTLTTVAPLSESSMDAKGPAAVEQNSTTRIWCKRRDSDDILSPIASVPQPLFRTIKRAGSCSGESQRSRGLSGWAPNRNRPVNRDSCCSLSILLIAANSLSDDALSNRDLQQSSNFALRSSGLNGYLRVPTGRSRARSSVRPLLSLTLMT